MFVLSFRKKKKRLNASRGREKGDRSHFPGEIRGSGERRNVWVVPVIQSFGKGDAAKQKRKGQLVCEKKRKKKGSTSIQSVPALKGGTSS